MERPYHEADHSPPSKDEG